jgi:hypothetical protein
VNARTLLREVEKLEAERVSRRREIPADRVEFARSVGLKPDAWQEQLLRSNAPRVLMLCARQTGKSTAAAVVALHRALCHPASLVLTLAPAERQAKETFSKVAGFYHTLGHPIPADSYRKLGLELTNGSRIEALPGSERTIRGFSGVDLLLVDEASRVEDALYHAVRPMLATSAGRLILLSTPAGKRGVFFEEWTGGEGWERYEVPAEQCPRISAEFLEEERRALPAWIYRQEYECSFEDLDDALFGYDLVQSSITEEVTPLFEEAS